MGKTVEKVIIWGFSSTEEVLASLRKTGLLKRLAIIVKNMFQAGQSEN